MSQKHFGTTGRCGGSLVSNAYVVTAAHCIDGADLTQNRSQAIYGCNDITSPACIRTGLDNWKWTASNYVNEDNPFRLDNDIAMVRLATFFQSHYDFPPNVGTICLPDWRFQLPWPYMPLERAITVLGWGGTDIALTLSNRLKEVCPPCCNVKRKHMP